MFTTRHSWPRAWFSITNHTNARISRMFFEIRSQNSCYLVTAAQASPLLRWRVGVWVVWRVPRTRQTTQTPAHLLQTGARLSRTHV